MINFLIVFFSLFFLLVLHEFSHFLTAKRFGVKVEEFGIGYPPRLFGKKLGETIYSINLLPFGAFVRMVDKVEGETEKRGYLNQPVGKRLLIALAGVLSFWIISAIIFSILFIFGNPVAISDETISNLTSPKVQIIEITKNSPAQNVGLIIGDIIKKIKIQDCQPESQLCEKETHKVKEVQEFIKANLGKEIILTIERGKETFDVTLVPRISYPQGEGPIGVSLARITIEKYPIHLAIGKGLVQTFNLTFHIIQGYFIAIKNIFSGVPSGLEIRGPVGIFQIAFQILQLGFIYFFNFLGLLSIYLAILNVLPIPAFDGGKCLFLAIEIARKKPIAPETEQKITAFFFTLLIIFASFVMIKDILRLL